MKMNGTTQEMKKYLVKHRRKKRWLTVVTCLAAVVVFCTVYALVLPAIALEKEQTLNCTYEVHQHDDTCYDAAGKVICGYADYVVHTHDADNCYDAEGGLVCELAEIEEHVHDASCYEERTALACDQEETGGHVHDTSCYTSVQGQLICENTDEGHVHTDECYEWTEILGCGLEAGEGAHQHTDECYAAEKVLVCEKPEIILHTHTDECYEDILGDNGEVIGRELVCGKLQVEKHVHDESCLAVSDDEEDGIAALSNEDESSEVTAAVTINGQQYSTVLTAVTDTDTQNLISSVNAYAAALSGIEDRTTSDIDFYRITSLTDSAGNPVDLSSLGGDAAVIITYPEGSCLEGTAGSRKLLVLDMGADGEAQLSENSELAVSQVSKEDDGYTGFTYTTTISGLQNIMAFTSLKLLDGYVQALTVDKIIDGTAPWDASDSAGNDSSSNNNRIRTFDTIEYDLEASFLARSIGNTLSTATLGFEMTMDRGLAEAEFAIESMGWLGSTWKIEYFNDKDELVLIKTPSGLYTVENGVQSGKSTTINSLVYGSSGDNTDGNAYKDTLGIVSQRLTGTYTVTNTTDNVVPGNQTLAAFVHVTASQNGDVIEPSFKVWLVGNEANFGPEDNDNSGSLGADAYARMKTNTVSADKVTVSAAARYNVMVIRNSEMSYASWFDFETGKEAVKNTDDSYSENAVHGRMLGYGITLQLYNETDSKESGALSEKGLRGIELPSGDITFDLTLKSSVSSSSADINDYTPVIWDYTENVSLSGNSKYLYNGKDTPQKDVGNWERNMYWGYETRTRWAKGAGPLNSMDGGDIASRSCYDGGYWNMNWSANGGTNDGGFATQKDTAVGDGSNVTYSFTVSGYTFDFDNWSFPSGNTGNSGTAPWNASYVGSFSAGYIQVLQQYPVVIGDTQTLSLTVTASNLNASTKSGQTGKDGKASDNYVQYSVPQYAPGNITKGNSFGKANSTSYGAGFLGTEYWTVSYDPSTYAGTEVKLWGYGLLNTGSDNRIKAMNLLQKFDSTVLSIEAEKPMEYKLTSTPTGTITGSVTFLYAADPVYPGGYDTNAAEDYTDELNRLVGGMMGGSGKMDSYSRINTAEEEDLIYFESLADLENAGYVCVGVLMELRECDIQGGVYIQMAIPMKVSSGEKYIGSTVCSVNTVRTWLGSGIGTKAAAAASWKNTTSSNPTLTNGKSGYELSNSSGNSFTNTPPEGYSKPTTASVQPDDPGYGFTLVNNPEKGYIKTEYDENHKWASGTHLGGFVYGTSLLVLGYTSTVDIQVTNSFTNQTSSSTSDQVKFDVGNGQWSADYTITNIKTKCETSTSSEDKTNLQIKVALLEDGVSIRPGSCQMTSIKQNADGQPERDSSGNYVMEIVDISDNQDNPTMVYVAYNDKVYAVRVYAEKDSVLKSMTIHLLDVPIGAQLSDITYTADISAEMTNNSTHTTTVAISGDGDKRSYSTEHDNYSAVTIGIIALGGTSLTKTVSDSLIELDDSFTYELRYTNNSSNPMQDTLYLYDIIPYNGDIRSSDYDGGINVDSISAYLGNDSGNAEDTFSAQVRFYYSTLPGDKLKNIIDFSGLPDTSGLWLRQLLGNALADNEGNLYFFLDSAGNTVDLYGYNETGGITVRNFTLNTDGYTVASVTASYNRFVKVTNVDYQNSVLVYSTEDATFSSGMYTKLFRYLGDLTPDSHAAITDDHKSSSSSFEHATCIYAIARYLGSQKTICIDIKVKTEDNEASNIYGNVAHSWISGSQTSHTLLSTQVYTQAVSREISGVTWYDANLNGVQDIGEATISGVNATLFQWNESEKKYIKCTADVTGAEINTLVTGADGAYNFSKLAAGEYVVAFSGDVLDKYTGATFYQVNGSNDKTGNDGVALNTTKSSLDEDSIAFAGIDKDDYSYAIAYSLNDITAGHMFLHTLDDYKAESSLLTNYKESMDHQDLGLIIAGYELPETGGTGTKLFTIGGLLLMAGAGGYGYGLRRRRERRAK